MIECLQIDDRLLHGRVITKWITQYNPDAIVIADDGVARDEIAKMALRIAKPDGMKMSIRSVEDAISLLKNEKTRDMRLFVMVKDSENAEAIVSATGDVRTVNVGGMVRNREGSKPIIGAIRMTDKDKDVIKRIYSLVDEIDIRTMPSDEKKNILKYL